MKNDSKRPVVELDMRPVVRFAAFAQDSKAGIDRLRQSEQLHRLIDQMRAKIEPESGARSDLLAPPLTNLRSKAVDVGFEVTNLSQQPGLDDCLRCQYLTIPATVVKYREQLS